MSDETKQRREWSGEMFEAACSLAAEYALLGLTTDGAHHKQWYLEKIARALGIDPEHMEQETGIEYERGIAP